MAIWHILGQSDSHNWKDVGTEISMSDSNNDAKSRGLWHFIQVCVDLDEKNQDFRNKEWGFKKHLINQREETHNICEFDFSLLDFIETALFLSGDEPILIKLNEIGFCYLQSILIYYDTYHFPFFQNEIIWYSIWRLIYVTQSLWV